MSSVFYGSSHKAKKFSFCEKKKKKKKNHGWKRSF